MCDSWKGYKPAPIEQFHGEAMEDFHAGAEHLANEIKVGNIRFINGIEFNRLLARFKLKIMHEYGITSDAIRIKEG